MATIPHEKALATQTPSHGKKYPTGQLMSGKSGEFGLSVVDGSITFGLGLPTPRVHDSTY
jgi:hypothetical protein